ncbi:tRNA-uridine aminocarboxypropyltransferase [Pseudomaricurvus sp. HS19]|uniref:tRNA-uridine aminocarboxypropyltransferase n=1 Tax=Pseudomaricurvus sp. HS19 TaxID=2692626 RepID=UPI00136D989F|nr:DTW domain-containing protein [Pseudomaricurvus sp. HS19]MYM62626.1 DTW domain-containing protein [Pseudomaricurvus sp. HS19]
MQPSITFPPHCVDQLRLQCERESTREFKARGYLLQRCPQCRLAARTCVCQWRSPAQCNTEFVLLMHRDEVFKPTNTGRLIADLFPGQCHAFAWSRLEPPAELLALLADPGRHCQILFPAAEGETRPVESQPTTQPGKIPTVVVLDGTWKQARKMAKHSKWLAGLPLLNPSSSVDNKIRKLGNYRIRQACDNSRLATAEAAALVLAAADEVSAANHLLDYFDVFNEHYVATRMNRQPQTLAAHSNLQEHALSQAG